VTDRQGFELDFVITEEQLVHFVRLRQRLLNIVGALVGIGLIGAGIYFAVTGDPVFGVFEIGAGALILVTSQTPILDRWRVRRAASKVIGTRAHFDVDESGINIQNAGTAIHVEWPAITNLKVNDKIIIPMRGGLPVGWMPTDAFASSQAREEALAYMRLQIEARSPRRK
jgi:hypothetical protein